mmetsp:Transcript_25444/g.52953  ORF Transcript_25444/g.52953 Transcript_25444/m.52953 type:complete len:499 (-) Transcript_25444:2150-3646(-)
MSASTSLLFALPTFMASIFQCSLAVLAASIYYGRQILVAAGWPSSSEKAPTVDDSDSFPRVMLPREIVFDETARNALNILDENYAQRPMQQKLRTKQTPLDGDIEAPPFVDETDSSSCSSDSESSQDSLKNKKQQASIFSAKHGSENGPLIAQALRTLRSAGNQDRLTLTCTGYKGGLVKDQVNQDRGMVVCPLLPFEKRSTEDPDNNVTMLVGVLDGHGSLGHKCADFCRKELELDIPTHMQRLISEAEKTGGMDSLSPKVVARELERIVQDVDERIPYYWGRDGGSTMSMVLQLGEWIYLINTGDSQSFIGAFIESSQESLVLRVTQRHEPTLPQEVKRIHQAGASISPDGNYVIYNHVNEQHGLAMTRSLGDHLAPGVIPTPSITFASKHALVQQALQQSGQQSTNMESDAAKVSLFAVAVSDGILDVLDEPKGSTSGPVEIAHVMGNAFFGQRREREHALVATRNYIDVCAERWYMQHDGQYRDDIVVAASKIL